MAQRNKSPRIKRARFPYNLKRYGGSTTIASHDIGDTINSTYNRQNINSFGEKTLIHTTGNNVDILSKGECSIAWILGDCCRARFHGKSSYAILSGNNSIVSMLGEHSTLLLKNAECIFRLGDLSDVQYEYTDDRGVTVVYRFSTYKSSDSSILIQPNVYYRFFSDGKVKRMISSYFGQSSNPLAILGA